MKTFTQLSVALLAVVSVLNASLAMGQFSERAVAGPGQNQYAVDPDFLPQPEPPVRLGFIGAVIPGGMLVNSVDYNSPAFRIGLEAGDVITHVNHQRIDCFATYHRILQHALDHHHGQVSVRIKNVRYPYQSHEPYVYRTLQLPHVHQDPWNGGNDFGPAAAYQGNSARSVNPVQSRQPVRSIVRRQRQR